jgi:hypothetical protein
VDGLLARLAFSTVSSTTRMPLSFGAVAESSSRSSTLRRFISLGSHVDSGRNRCSSALRQALRSYRGFGVSQGSERLVTFCWQQPPLELAAKSLTSGARAEEVVEACGIVFKWSVGGAYGRAFAHGEAPPPPLEHNCRPSSTNHR